MAATLFAGVAAGQPYPDSLGEELGDWPLWRAALKSLEPDGSIEWSLPDFGEIDPVAAIWARERIDQFREKFGSAESQGLEELSYPPESYCYVPDYETVVGTYPDPGVASLDGILLLSEVAVTATVSEIIPGFPPLRARWCYWRCRTASHSLSGRRFQTTSSCLYAEW
ncbi:MAG: hypothetical protein OXU63_11030 [Acidobacteriota bacterium]|nr:hypothetical protein [Acidobacteriota bacterium]